MSCIGGRQIDCAQKLVLESMNALEGERFTPYVYWGFAGRRNLPTCHVGGAMDGRWDRGQCGESMEGMSPADGAAWDWGGRGQRSPHYKGEECQTLVSRSGHRSRGSILNREPNLNDQIIIGRNQGIT